MSNICDLELFAPEWITLVAQWLQTRSGIEYIVSFGGGPLSKISLISIVSVWGALAGATSSVTVSGISSGGFMASQMATIYSDKISGVATVAGGFYHCAQNGFQENLSQFGALGFFAYGVPPSGEPKTSGTSDLVVPLERNPIYQSVGVCMKNPQHAAIDQEYIGQNAAQGLIAPTSYIAQQKVLIYQGDRDEVVNPLMAQKIKDFYSLFGVTEENIKMISNDDGAHNFPTDRKDGILCRSELTPYIASCDLDLAGEILNHLLSRTLIRGKAVPENFHVVEHRDQPKSIAPQGYLYANKFCLANPQSCDLHVALHGCEMNDSFDSRFQKLYSSKIQITRILGVTDEELKVRVPRKGALTFARKSGYAEYAEPIQNRLMVYFPQTQITTDNFPANPKGCWDWYGWTGSDYATNRGLETSWLMGQISLLRQNPNGVISKSPALSVRDRF